MTLVRKLRRRLFYPTPDTLAYTIEYLNATERARAVLGPYGAPLDDSFRDETRTSDTLAVLGSGPSVNALGAEVFDWIDRQDSIGFNWWLAHPFAPDMYLLQGAPLVAGVSPIRRLLEHSEPRWRGRTRFVLRGNQLATNPAAMRAIVDGLVDPARCRMMTEFQLHGRLEAPIPECFEFAERLGLMPRGRIPPFVVKWQATLGVVLSLAYNMGYERVVLFGIDMTSDAHFFDSPAYAEARRAIGLPEPKPGAITGMTDARRQATPVADAVVALARLCEERGGMRTVLAAPGSALEGRLPAWEGP
jgi:hypothetical protein